MDVDRSAPTGTLDERPADDGAGDAPASPEPAAAGTPVVAGGPSGPWWTRRWFWVGLVTAVSVALHAWKLGDRPLAHDEAIDAWFSWDVRDLGIARYDPVYHGPLRFYVEGLTLRAFGIGATQARIVAAAAGVATTVTIAASTRTLGRVGAPVAALLFTISPTILTVTRTGREDSLVVLYSAAMLLLVARALTEPRAVHLVGLGGLLAASFATKETTFLFGLAAFVFFAGGLVVAGLRPDGACRRAASRLGGLGREPWMLSFIAFVLVFAVAFTSGFRYVDGLTSGMLDGVAYWWSQHDVGRGGQPWFFYLLVYAAYDWLLLATAVAGAIVVWRTRSLPGAWFAWMTLSQVVLYSWAGEKFAWLAVHPLVPAVLLAGLGAEAIAGRLGRSRNDGPRRALERRPVRVVLGGGLAVLTVTTAWISVRPAVLYGADPRELLVTVQTSVDVPPVARRLRELHGRGEIETIVVDAEGGGAWPWAWYLVEMDGVEFRPVDQGVPLPDADAVIVLAGEFPPDVPEGATVERFRLREWWVPDYGAMTASDWWSWFFTRRTWTPTASLDQYLVIREP
jgi:uncharacterized protein (TIGR03663 family)